VAALIAQDAAAGLNITRYKDAGQDRYQITRLPRDYLRLAGTELAALAALLDDLRERGWTP
jgi:hypothetical protein